MLELLILHLVAALVAPLLVHRWGPRACYLLALPPAAAFGWALVRTPDVVDGGAVVETYPWIPQLGLDLSLRMTTLSWLMTLLVGGVGALVLVYSARYFPPGAVGNARFAGVMVAFAGAMLGLVLADDLLLLYVGWELTTVFSYLLIGHSTERRSSRWAAAQALIVTTLGGLAMLVGFIMLGHHAGTYRWSELAERPLPGGGHLVVAVLLILLGALSKSAVLPFTSWLPVAMAAPTPVSAYLHAAAMVKAGVYLLGLLAPVLAVAGPWRPVVVVAGLATMLLGGWAALRQTDLKLLLAHGTVSQLGLLTVVIGVGTADAALAGVAMLLAHALFKAALFLVVGVIDHGAGTRDLRELSGLRRTAPVLTGVAVLAAASMAGLPPLLGFVAKEAVFAAFTDQPLVLAGLVAGTALTVAYSIRFLWGAFATRPGAAPTELGRIGLPLLVPPLLLAVVGLVAGPAAGVLDHLLRPYPELLGSVEEHLALWHGLTPALGLSALAVAGGAALFALRGPLAPALARLRSPVTGQQGYEWITQRFDRAAVDVTSVTQRGSLPQYLGLILIVLAAVPGGALFLTRPWEQPLALWGSPAQPVVLLVISVAALLAVGARRRLTAMLLVGMTGYGTAMLFVLYGAPDLALTQFLVETMTIAIFVLVLRRLPERFSIRPLRRSRWIRRTIGVIVGTTVAGLAVGAAAARQARSISEDFPHLAVEQGHGRNVVNVTLVDIRAWDTLGEVAVLVVAATGVASLIFQQSRTGPRPRRRDSGGEEAFPGRPVWLRGGATLHERHRSIVLEVVTRLISHTAVVFSLYLLFSGHNAPGGGFAGGLVASLALTMRYLAGGRYELVEAAPIGAGTVLGAGLLLTVGSAVVSLLAGGAVLRSTTIDLWLPVIGDFYLVTSLFFDVGVYLVVIGLALDVLRSLGAEVDRHIEAAAGGPAAAGGQGEAR
ncbi:multicomponent Na+:H+ antiporter subunit A [Micromonospora phaseoli]|uniref:Multicomponent Na+:H+ antiporter subunit A n=1 Tax=Micromonospora phaseoli TaxID=1144548 RepID=A0A1H6RXT1_9ACTN|nr:Na+/H+ antiporter subunit A [Micromonospora phaseoli]PZW03558.1 multisubunit sodium/proton antiporter MrpA subunit /multisubunit sodium/proton antiporter MrpB subunit [Micromonospora phaseoli]GIJ77124.1 putative cation antiporter NADH dehydrogenase subunit [Micromonospora phaseoli]SEI56600.1 multicomponent Na+:H+ antiporter subunit A [Micromonospora phaseoli]